MTLGWWFRQIEGCRNDLDGSKQARSDHVKNSNKDYKSKYVTYAVSESREAAEKYDQSLKERPQVPHMGSSFKNKD